MTTRESVEARVIQGEGCWSWTGSHGGQDRRPSVTYEGRQQYVYRLMWQWANDATIPHGLSACHTCDNPSCVNPSHIFIGTALDNLLDCMAKGRWRGVACPTGEAHHEVKITDRQVREARESYAAGIETQQEIADRLSTAQATVGAWLRGRYRREAGGPFTSLGKGSDHRRRRLVTS